MQGSIFFTVSCKDDGGTLNDGTDSSNSIGVNIVILGRNSPPTFVDLPSQVSFSEWSFAFSKFDSEPRRAFVFGQALDSYEYVRSQPSVTTLTEVSLSPIYGLVSGFQQILGGSNELLSQSILKSIDDWYVCLLFNENVLN